MRVKSPRTVLGVSFALISLGFLVSLSRNGQRHEPALLDVYQVDRKLRPPHPASHGALQSYGHRASLRENLNPDLDYLISFPMAGFNNQVMCFLNPETPVIDAAQQSGRSPILVPFRSDGRHNGVEGTEMHVGDVFDLESLSGTLAGLPLVEFRDLKALRDVSTGTHSEVDVEAITGWSNVDHNLTIHHEAPEMEPLGCWSFSLGRLGHPTSHTPSLALDLDFTPLPSDVWGQEHYEYRASLTALAQHLRPRRGHSYSLSDNSRALLEKWGNDIPELDPDDHVACVDHMYNFSDDPIHLDSREEFRNGVGTWARVGQHMRYKPSWLKLADKYLRRIFEVPNGAPIPPYIGVHVRRGDFGEDQRSITPRAWAYAVFRVQTILKERMGIDVRHVLITTNEQDQQWLAQFDAYEGFRVVNHDALGTTAIDPIWHPTILDTIFLSTGMGLVGLQDSTMAILAQKRVMLWKGGVGLLIAPWTASVPEGWEYPYMTGH